MEARSPAAHKTEVVSRMAEARATLQQKSRIVFPQCLCIAVRQRAHEFKMQIVHHTGTGREELLPEFPACRIHRLAECAVQVATRSARLYLLRLVKPHLGDLHPREPLRLE